MTRTAWNKGLKLLDTSKRKCFLCNSKTTYISKEGKTHWREHPFNKGEYFCNNCYGLIAKLVNRKGYQLDSAIEEILERKNNIIEKRNLYSKYPLENRKCDNCATTETYIDKTGRHHWRFIKDNEGNVLKIYCRKCWDKLIGSPKYNPLRNKRRMTFKYKQICVDHVPRTGFCSKCGKAVGKTHLHHEIYDDSDPLANTMELCQSCHSKRSWELGQITGYKLNRTKKPKSR